jgi:Zn-dependent protease with chaperone function
MYPAPAITFNFTTVDDHVTTYGVSRTDAVRFVEMIGGATAYVINDQIRSIATRLNPELDLSAIPNGYKIEIFTDFFNDELFSRKEIDAVLAREEGHIVLGHIDAGIAEMKLGSSDENEIKTNLEFPSKDEFHILMTREIDADKYAARKVGAAHMLSILQKYPSAMATFIAREGSSLSKEELEGIYQKHMHMIYAPRIAALEQMTCNE